MTAIIRWKPAHEGGRRTPPASNYRTVAHFEADPRWPDEAWTLLVNTRWLSPNAEITVADVQFLMDDAPHSLLMPGARFELLEGDRVVATGMITPAHNTLEQIDQLAEAI